MNTAGFLLSLLTVVHLLHAPLFACDNKLQLALQDDKPLLRIKVSSHASLQCCYTNDANLAITHHWLVHQRKQVKTTRAIPPLVLSPSPRVIMEEQGWNSSIICQKLTVKEVQVSDTGFYLCVLNSSDHCLFTHGTYLQAYIPLHRLLDMDESWKNSLITLEGVLLLFSVLIPGICQLGKTKRLTQLNRKKLKEEENIYEGLNLDDCSSVYHQIQRSQMHGPYQDVANVAEDDIQFEKP